MSDVVTFGEAMIRLSPPYFQRLEQAATLDVQVGGAELNVATAVSRLGLSAAWISRLPDNPLGRKIRNKAREQGVNTEHIAWAKQGRAGVYFVEFGASPRASSVLYDRSGSAISQIQPGEVDWAAALQGARWFHTSGITPALSTSAAAVTREALQAARKAGGLRVSYDLNYRAKLWTAEQARQFQEPLMELVDVLITTEEDTRVVFGIAAAGADERFATVSAEPYKEVARKLVERFGLQAVAITLRENPSVWRNTWTAIAYAGGQFYEDRKYELEVVDRLGGGDAFTAGFIYGCLTSGFWQTAIEYGNASSALKHTHPGDLGWATLPEVQGLLKGAGLRVAR